MYTRPPTSPFERPGWQHLILDDTDAGPQSLFDDPFDLDEQQTALGRFLGADSVTVTTSPPPDVPYMPLPIGTELFPREESPNYTPWLLSGLLFLLTSSRKKKR